jgi:hypothetical protein
VNAMANRALSVALKITTFDPGLREALGHREGRAEIGPCPGAPTQQNENIQAKKRSGGTRRPKDHKEVLG